MASASITESWHKFTQETTMHGIRYVKIKEISIVRRVIWGMMIIGMLTYFCYAGYLFLDAYFKRSIITQITVKNARNLTFPTVTFCNQNYWKYSKVETAASPPELKEFLSNVMKDIYVPSSQSPPPANKYNWSDPVLMGTIDANRDHESHLKELAHTMEETFVTCLIKGSQFPCEQMLTQVKTDAGICYQFNRDGKFTSHTAGLSGGVQLILDALTHEYYTGPFSLSEGFSVAMHDKNVIPLVSELSYGVATGTHTVMTIQKKKTKRVPPPADDNQSNCFDTKTQPNPLHFYTPYSREACSHECLISHILRACGCVDFLHPPLNDSKVCNFREMVECVTPARREYFASSKYLELCSCASSCEETQYFAKLSSYTYPSDRHAYEMKKYTNVSKEYMKKNYVAVDLYYGQMSYELLEERVAYKVSDMVASLGGTLGVCIGASLLTLVEFIEFLVITISGVLAHCKTSSSGGTQVIPINSAVPAD